MQVAMLESKITHASTQPDMQKLSAELDVLHRTWAGREATLQGLRDRWRELQEAVSGLCRQGLAMFGVPEPGTDCDAHSSRGTGSRDYGPLPLSPAAAVQQALHRAAVGLQGLLLWSLTQSTAEDGASAASTESWQADAALLGCLHSVLQEVCSGPEELAGGSVDSVGSGSSSPAVARQGPLLHPAAAAAAAAEVAELELAGLVQRHLLPRLQSALQASQSHLARIGASEAGSAAEELQDLSLLEVDDLIPDYSSHPPGAWRPVPDMEPLTGTEASQGAADEEHPLASEPGPGSSIAPGDGLLASPGTFRQQQQQLESGDNSAGGVGGVLELQPFTGFEGDAGVALIGSLEESVGFSRGNSASSGAADGLPEAELVIGSMEALGDAPGHPEGIVGRQAASNDAAAGTDQLDGGLGQGARQSHLLAPAQQPQLQALQRHCQAAGAAAAAAQRLRAAQAAAALLHARQEQVQRGLAAMEWEQERALEQVLGSLPPPDPVLPKASHHAWDVAEQWHDLLHVLATLVSRQRVVQGTLCSCRKDAATLLRT